MASRVHRRIAAVGVGIAGVALVMALAGGCGATEKAVARDPEAALTEPRLSAAERALALDELWSQAATRQAARERIKAVAWGSKYPTGLRIAAVNKLAADPEDANSADTRAMIRLLMQDERDSDVRAALATLAGEKGWVELAPVVVRSLAQANIAIPPPDRAEYQALRRMFPERSVEATAFEVFVTPVSSDASEFERSRSQRVRDAAWVVLGRLDRDGTRRRALIDGAPAGDATIEAVRAAQRELGVVPLTPTQVQWVRELHDFGNPGTLGPSGEARRAWWAAAAQAVATLRSEQRQGLALRHIEPLRWASQERSAWLSASRDELLAMLRQRLEGRRTRGRGVETLSAVSDRLAWGDVLMLLAIDDAMRSPGLSATLWDHAIADNKDTSTEYGGYIESAGGGAGGGAGFRAALFPPRVADRQGDRKYVAPPEMFQRGPSMFVHYHFHAQSLSNADYAGPGPGDMAFANEQGRACVVLTPVGDGVLDVSVYTAGPVIAGGSSPGIIIGLGELRR